jgi:hypothetical protein
MPWQRIPTRPLSSLRIFCAGVQDSACTCKACCGRSNNGGLADRVAVAGEQRGRFAAAKASRCTGLDIEERRVAQVKSNVATRSVPVPQELHHSRHGRPLARICLCAEQPDHHDARDLIQGTLLLLQSRIDDLRRRVGHVTVPHLKQSTGAVKSTIHHNCILLCYECQEGMFILF